MLELVSHSNFLKPARSHDSESKIKPHARSRASQPARIGCAFYLRFVFVFEMSDPIGPFGSWYLMITDKLVGRNAICRLTFAGPR